MKPLQIQRLSNGQVSDDVAKWYPKFQVIYKEPGSGSDDPLILVSTLGFKWMWNKRVYGMFFYLKPFSENWKQYKRLKHYRMKAETGIIGIK